MIISFYVASNGRWYADIPSYIEDGGSHDDLMMVAGADTWLDIISNYSDRITLQLELDGLFGIDYSKFNKIEKVLSIPDGGGATYLAKSYNGEDFNHYLWLCPVTEYVFGDYPNTIYYRKHSGIKYLEEFEL